MAVETQTQHPFDAAAPQCLHLFPDVITSYSIHYTKLYERFDSHLASLGPEEFIRVILLEGVGVKYLVVGDDFHFGKGRVGNFSTLQRAGADHGFTVVNMHTFNIGDSRVSSTRIREALQQGDFKTAESLLGRNYRMSGRVAHGDKRGRTIV